MTTHTDSFLWSKFIFVFEMCETTKKLENIWPRNITEKTKIMKYDENEKKSKIYHFFPNENSSEK